MSDIGPQRAAPSSAARVEAQHRDAVKAIQEIGRAAMALMCRDLVLENLVPPEPDKRGELFADCVMREMLSAAIQRLRNASIEASIYDPDEPDIAAGMRIAYAGSPELTIDGWMCADISVVCEFARHALECGLSMPKKQENDL